MKRLLSVFLAVAAVGALVPAVASAAETVVKPASAVKLGGLQSKGWVYYCPSSHPYVKSTPSYANGRYVTYKPVGVENRSDGGVTLWMDHLNDAGKLAVGYTNWKPWGASGNLSYTCTTVHPLDQ